MIMVAVVALTAYHPGFCLGGRWATIGVSIAKKDEAAAVQLSSRFRGMWTIMGRFAGKRSRDDKAKLETASAISSAHSSQEGVSAQ